MSTARRFVSNLCRGCAREFSSRADAKTVFCSRTCANVHTFVKHGDSKSPEHRVWSGMLKRCYGPNTQAFKHYGGRGITVCERWKNYSNFLNDMGRRPSPSHSIERIDNGGNYEPSNCRWATSKEQCNNRTSNVVLTIGAVSKTVTEWCELTGQSTSRVYRRVRRGLRGEAAVYGAAIRQERA